MYWDTTDLFNDSDKQLKIKSYRRKCNYYESKTDALDSCCESINQKMNQITIYKMTRSGVSTEENHVMNYKYYEAERLVFKECKSEIEWLNEQLTRIKGFRDTARELFEKYHRLAEED